MTYLFHFASLTLFTVLTATIGTAAVQSTDSATTSPARAGIPPAQQLQTELAPLKPGSNGKKRVAQAVAPSATPGTPDIYGTASSTLPLPPLEETTTVPLLGNSTLDVITSAALLANPYSPLPPTTATVDLFDVPSVELPPLQIPSIELPPASQISAPVTTDVIALDSTFDQPTSLTVPLAFETAIAPPFTSESTDLVDLGEFERYLESRITRIEEIDLNSVVVRAVCRNLDIKLSDIDHLIADDEFYARQGIFDLRISGINQVIRTQTPSGTVSGFGTGGFNVGTDTDNGTDNGEPVVPGEPADPRNDGDVDPEVPVVGNFGGGGGDSKRIQNRVSVAQLLPTGGQIELIFDNTSVVTDSPESPQATTRAGLQARQPLLRNAGPFVTQSNIILAEFDTQITASQFRQQVMEEVAAAINQYYELVFAVSNVEVLRIALAQAEELLRVNRAKYEAGVLPQLEVLEALADVATRQQDVIVALQQVEAASDLLRAQLAEIDTPCPVSLRPAETPRVPDYSVREYIFLDEAVAFRPEMEQARLNIDKQDVNTRVAHNQTLPQVDLFGSYTPTGTDDDRLGSIREAGRTRTEDWSVGLQWSYPLQNREARFRFHQAEKRIDQAFIRLQQIRNEIVLQVREAIRGFETNRASIRVSRTAVEFNRATVEAGLQRQLAGLITSTDVLEFQRNLANARITLLRSVIDYNKAIVEIERSKGTLLESLGILVCDNMILKSPNKPKKALGLSQ